MHRVLTYTTSSNLLYVTSNYSIQVLTLQQVRTIHEYLLYTTSTYSMQRALTYTTSTNLLYVTSNYSIQRVLTLYNKYVLYTSTYYIQRVLTLCIEYLLIQLVLTYSM